MILNRLININYKSARYTEIEIQNNTPTVLIGENDCGKTTSLQSIKFLLDPKFKINVPNSQSEKSDLCHTSLSDLEINSHLKELRLPSICEDSISRNSVLILGKFAIEGFEFDADSDCSSQLKYILEHNSELVIARLFNVKDGSDEFYYMVEQPEDKVLSDLFELNDSKLNNAMKIYNPDSINLENDNGKGKHSIYEKVRSIIKTVDTSVRFSLVPAKKIKEDLKVFPIYSYLSWEGSLDGITTAAKSILDNAISEEIEKAERTSKELSRTAQEKIDQRLNMLGIQKEVASIEEVSAKVGFELKSQLTDLFIKKATSVDPIHIENQGEGVKRQIWFALLKLQSDLGRLKETNKRYIWCFDEPETHLHPKAQREFISTLRDLALQNFQIIVSSHSTIFVDSSSLEDIRSFDMVNSNTNITTVRSVGDVHESLGVQNSDILFYNKFIVVEGDTEEGLIPILYEKIVGTAINKDDVKIINMGGCGNKQLADEILTEIFTGFSDRNDNYIFILDNDTGVESGNQVYKVGRQDLEDTIPTYVWLEIAYEIFGDSLVLDAAEIDELRDGIPTMEQNNCCSNSQKMAGKLKAYIYRKLTDSDNQHMISMWMDKGKEWGVTIGNKIKVDDIPLPIKQAIESVK
ncbi:AAA family ATPase [Vibrio astriarenae]|uniref:AAA family ATPase n=1 Tax=Vibrio astriarenae TaxID=1481923 RepID=A0A7Z2T3A2_9VIBR|nr:AAA family ATPase [Vibrio astriarenae]QIA63561.1 AAA family ATPase [Vibrio astriarenae]